jgi:hypothetical protein
LTYFDGGLQTIHPSPNGDYTIAIPPSWTGTVTPAKVGYTFTPGSRFYNPVTANVSGENYAASPTPFTISGNAAYAGTKLSYVDGTTKTVTADGAGNYSFVVHGGWSGTVTPSLSGYAFTPGSRNYTNVVSDFLNENYTAVQVVYASYPANVSQACRKPPIGVDVLVTDLMRKTDGSLDPSKVALKLDGTNVLNTATIRERTVYPSVHATILYTPPSNLSLGIHQTEFTFPTEGGPANVDWSFNAANIACGTTLQSQPEAGGTASSQAASSELVAAPSAPAPAGTTAQITAPTQPASVAPLAQATQAPATRPRGHQGGIDYRRLLIPR